MSCAGTRHGTLSAYENHGCTCPSGREAERLYRERLRAGRHRRMSSIGTARRVQGLMALGYSCNELGRLSGLHGDMVSRLARETDKTVFVSTAWKVKQLADSLIHRRLPTGGPATQTMLRAYRNGYIPLGAWVNIDDPDEKPTGKPRIPLELRQRLGIAYREAA